VEFLQSGQVADIVGFRLPRYHELPNIDLYMDQVILLIESHLKPLFTQEDKSFITSTMVSNYVKQGVVSPPVKKKYTKTHLAYLMVVCIFKQIFSISQICDLIHRQIDTYPMDIAYDYFCEELEKALGEVFSVPGENHAQSLASQVTPESELVRKTAIAFANYIYVRTYLNYLAQAKDSD